MATQETYFIRVFHGVNEKNEPIHTYNELTYDEYRKIDASIKLRQFYREIGKAYEFIVFNYRDYELNNYSTCLLYTSPSPRDS